MKPFISVDEAYNLSKTAKNILFIDTRYDFNKEDNYNTELFEKKHIKDAIYLDIGHDLSRPRESDTGRHPLPHMEKFKETLEKKLISKDLHIICYDDTNGGYTARLWFMLYTTGFESVQILDGGFSEWLKKNYPVSSGPSNRTLEKKITLNMPADWSKGKIQVLNYDDVQELVSKGFTGLIDARDGARFRGETASFDPVKGHIPGASNRWWKASISDTGVLRDNKELKKEFDLLFVNNKPSDSVLYCGSGVTACFNLAVMKQIGYSEEPRLYPGSFSDWIAHTNKVEP